MKAGVTTGPEIVAILGAAAARRGIHIEAFVRPLCNREAAGTWLRRIGAVKYATAPTIDRIKELVDWDPATPLPNLPPPRGAEPAPPNVAPVDREPCPYCAVRGDIGCRHRPRITAGAAHAL